MSSTTLATDNINVDQENRLEAASKAISNACGWSAGAALLPIPVLDLAALAAVQAQLCNDIAKIYGHTFSSEASKSTNFN